MLFMQPEFWARWLQIVLIDLALAGDNALVIALAVRGLPARQQFWGRIWGAGGAVTLRVCFIWLVMWLLRIPLLQLVGGLALIWIAIKLVRPAGETIDEVRAGASLREAIRIIILADVVMSLDNVIAIAAAAGGDLLLVAFGLLLSIPLVVWGSRLLARLMNRFPLIIWLGGGVLGYVAVEMIFRDPVVGHWLRISPTTWGRVIALILGAIITILGWQFASREARATLPRDSR
jgi:YjbE family integral membrane protein